MNVEMHKLKREDARKQWKVCERDRVKGLNLILMKDILRIKFNGVQEETMGGAG